MDWAVFASFSLWSVIGCWGMYLWTKDIVGGELAPLAGAVLFTLSPYHLNQLYNSFMLGEFVSLAVLPFAFCFTRRLCDTGSTRNLISLVFSISALILSNIPQMVVCFPFLALYALLCIDRKRVLEQVTKLAASGILAALFTSFYWVRVVAEMSWIHISEPNKDPNYDFRNNFLFSATEAGPEGIGIGSIMLLLVVALAVVVLFASGRYKFVLRNRQTMPLVAILILSTLLALPLSRQVWETFDLLQRVQFPWRFLSVTSAAATAIMAYGIGAVNRQSMRENRPLLLIMIGCVLILATFSVRQVILGAVFSEPGAFNRTADASATANGLYHWWPVWANKETFQERSKVVANQREVSIHTWGRDRREFSIAPGTPSTVRAAVLYYPWWHATVNGQDVETHNLGGALAFDIGPETSDCSLSFREPAYTFISRIVAFVSLFGTLIFLVGAHLRRSFVYE